MEQESMIYTSPQARGRLKELFDESGEPGKAFRIYFDGFG